MKVYITTVNDYFTDSNTKNAILNLLDFAVKNPYAISNAEKRLTGFLNTLRPELKIIIETDYVDKVYRDSFYSYYSTKLKSYNRNCLKLSFFEPFFNDINGFLAKSKEEIQSQYCGFLVLRPLVQCIGRNCIKKEAKKKGFSSIGICKTSIDTSCFGIKLKAEGFPHSSQDGEYMTCAETTIWSLMEYFGNKYPLHQPVMPTEVLRTIKSSAFERSVPSAGLNLNQISLALKEQGFGCKIYDVSNPRFKELFTCYIESGLPLAVSISGQNVGHAVVALGRLKGNLIQLKDNSTAINKHYCFWNKCVDNFVFNDDNLPCYSIADFNDPASYFGKTHIAQFIVPLHKKIYLPAEQAIEKSNFLLEKEFNVSEGSIVRTFLTSNRTYREYLFSNDSLSSIEKQVLLTLEMPKFIWITEISTLGEFKVNKVNSIIILDATGYALCSDVYSSLIFMKNADTIIAFDEISKTFKRYNVKTSQNFVAFQGNLK